jgi:hypothetical protein
VTEVLQQLFERPWPSPEKLLEFALARHGFACQDGIYGLTYPEDLHELQRAEGESIPEGYLELGYWNDGPRFQLISEQHYLQTLQRFLYSKSCIIWQGKLCFEASA